ncbi:MAG: MCE family protein [Bacteroidales bacterium]|nr:MCE family protein [Bacteroidales bacterium]
MKVSKELKVGIYVVVIGLVTFFVINYLKGHEFGVNTRTIYARFESVEGLTPATNVQFKGYKVGTIEDISYDNGSASFVVKFLVRGNYSIPTDSKAEIFSSDILGGKSIRVVPGTGEVEVRSGDTLQSSILPDMISSIVQEIGPLKEQLSVLLENLNTTVVSVNEVLDQQTRSDVKQAIASLRRALEKIDHLASCIDGRSPELEQIVVNLRDLTVKFGSIADNADTAMANVKKISDELAEAQLQETIDELKNLIVKIQDPNGSLGRLMSTDTLHESVNSLIIDIDTLIKKIEKNPKKYLKLSVF